MSHQSIDPAKPESDSDSGRGSQTEFDLLSLPQSDSEPFSKADDKSDEAVCDPKQRETDMMPPAPPSNSEASQGGDEVTRKESEVCQLQRQQEEEGEEEFLALPDIEDMSDTGKIDENEVSSSYGPAGVGEGPRGRKTPTQDVQRPTDVCETNW